MRINEILVEGWGAEPANRAHEASQAAHRAVKDKYKHDPEATAILNHLVGYTADQAEKEATGKGKYSKEYWARDIARRAQDKPIAFKRHTPFESVVDEEPASRDLCTSGKPDSALGASQLSSCKSQGYRARDGGKSHKIGSERIKVRGKRIKGAKYGGPIPDYS